MRSVSYIEERIRGYFVNCLNHDFNKIFKMNKINIFSTETLRTQSCTEKIILNHSIHINHSSDRIMTSPQPPPKEGVTAPPQPSPKGREHLPAGQLGMRQCYLHYGLGCGTFPSFGGVRGGLNPANLINLTKIIVQTKLINIKNK